MYVPSHFRVADPSTIQTLIRDNSFGTLVSSGAGAPVATHLPFLLRTSGESLELAGHIARTNPQADALSGGEELLAIFQGPHAYISPRWYTEGAVPTWNYQSVHCYGIPTVISDSLMRGIVGFRIRVTRTEASCKLSQNKRADDVGRVITGLRGRGDEASRKVAEAMEQQLWRRS